MMKAKFYITLLWAALLLTTSLKSQTYCPAKGTLPWEHWMERVSLAPANFSHPSVKEGYGNFTALTGMTIKRGSVNLLTISPRASWDNDPRNANIFWRVWIDYNGDGDFTDADEQVISRQVVFTNGIFLDNETTFGVPTTARLGNTRLRVAMKVGGYPSSCETFERGEVEDYTIAITDGSTTGCRFQDSLQLVSLYNATNPSTWLNKWNLNTPLNTWYGVSLNAEGCVVSVNLENNTMVGANLPTLNMPNLAFLNLRNNVLSGTIPNVNCPKLTGLLLAANQFTGTIPNYNCPNMRSLFLYGNRLTGTIPNFNYPNIVQLLLDGNQLTGTIPSFNAPFMNHFAVSFNRLTGSIPNFNFPVIDKLFIDNNQLSGCIPASFKAFCGKDVNITNNPGLATQNFTAFCSNNTGGCNQNQPDLTLANLTIPTPSVQQGQILNFRVDIKNIGTGNASANFNVKTYISTDNILSANDIQDGIIPTGNYPAGFSVLQVSGASTISATLPVGQYYLILKVDADNQITESNENNNVIVSATPFTVIGQTSENYCRSKGTAPWELWIAKVQFETINNTSDKFKDFNTLGYSNYTNISTTTTRGMTAILTVTPGLSWIGHLPNVYCRAWIDYNGNKIFEPSELIFQNTNVSPFKAAIRIPNVPVATTRLRVALKWGGYPESCQTFDRGEVEDYTLNFQTGTVLPIQTSILALEAHVDLDNAQLLWVYNQPDVDYFEIYKSDVQGVFQKIGVQNGMPQGVFQDNLQTYYFKNGENTEGVYLYQIKAIKYNGSSQMSLIKAVKIGDWSSVQVYPNPSSDELSIVLKHYANTEAKVLLYNSLGLVVKTLFLDTSNDALLKTEVSDLPTGQYYVRVVAKGKRDAVQRFSIVR